MKTVLYAEDYEDDIFFMRRALKEFAPGVRLVVAENGAVAIDYLTGTAPFEDRQANPLPDLVWLDLSMPVTNGFDVLEWARARPEFAKLPIFVLTSSDNASDRERALALGATGYLVKPGQPGGLVDLLRSCEEYLK